MLRLICSKLVIREQSPKGALQEKCFKYSRESTCAGVRFSTESQAYPTLLKKRLQQCFSVHFSKILRAPFHGAPPGE